MRGNGVINGSHGARGWAPTGRWASQMAAKCSGLSPLSWATRQLGNWFL